MLRARKLFAASCFMLALVVPRLGAQCAPSDGLDGGPCCAPAPLQVPRPKFQQQALGICWQNCNVSATATYVADWTALQPGFGPGSVAPCGWFTTNVELKSGTIVRWRGKLNATYARTWLEIDGAGNTYHVWRFLLNGDLHATSAAGPIPCPVPPCAPAFQNRVRFTGYVDYARNCSANAFQFAWMLSHVCDSIDHDPSYARGGAFHPDRSYTFVGPATGFVPGPLQPIEAGATPFESLRRWRVPPVGATGPVQCEFEERLATASLNPLSNFCLCAGGPTQQWVLSDLQVLGACGTNVQGGGAGLPYLSMGIGAWTIPGTFPGQESLRWNTGLYLYSDPCNGAVLDEFFFGVTTMGGYSAFQYLASGPGPALPPKFVDQANSKLFPTGNLTRNVPFGSDHVLNLNFP
jgi:hypothetical protein